MFFVLNNLNQTSEKLFAYSSLIIDVRMIIGISGESARHSLHTDVIFAYLFYLYVKIFKMF